MSNLHKALNAMIALSLLATGLSASRAQAGPAETAGQHIDRAAASTAKGIGIAMDKTGEALKTAGEKTGEALKKAEEKVEELVKKVRS